MSAATPRVNASLLPHFIGHNVRLVGRVISFDSARGRIQLETSDHKSVHVQSDRFASTSPEHQSTYVIGSCVEVVGPVQNDLSLTEYNAINFGGQFDLDNYDKAVQLIHGKYAKLFLPNAQ